MPSIALPVSLRGQLLYSTRIFNPVSLFAANEPGVWYDPSDVANLNWRRNLLTWTEQFDNAAWVKTNSSITANAVSAPDGTTTADKLVENTANSTHTASQAFTTSASTSYTFTVYAKADTRSHLDLSALTGFTTNPIVRFTLSGSGASSVRQGSPTPTHSIQSVGDGWYRCQINVTTVAGGSSTFQVALAVDASSSNFYTGDGTSGLFLWGAQLELGSVATDYQRITDVNTEVIERFPSATLFTDTAGTQPVTTPGQTVALALDKSKGLVLGPELVTNGDFSSGTTSGFTQTSGNVGTSSVISGELNVVAGGSGSGGFYQDITVTQGATYLLTVKGRRIAGAGSVRFQAYDGAAFTTLIRQFFDITTTGAQTSYSAYVRTTSTTTIRVYLYADTSTTGGFDDVSLKLLPGFHATQATAASRPTYGIVPATGRRNLLTRTEEFENAVYTTITTGGAVTRTASEIAFPATTSSSSAFVVRQAFTSLASNYTGSVELRAKAAGDVGKKVGLWLNDGSVTNFTWHTLTSDWVRITVTESMSAASSFWSVGILGDTTLGGVIQGAVTVEIRRAQLETGSSATAYQRVGSAFDVTEAGVASLSYLSFDGVDDFLVTPTITPGIDKAQVFAGVRKVSDAASSLLVETSTTSTSTANTIGLLNSTTTGGQNRFNSAGSVRIDAFATIAAPATFIYTGLSDVAAPSVDLRINSVSGGAATGSQGTVGNYAAHPIYIGRRGGTTAPFNGQLYSLIVRFGANLDAGTITSTETWVNGKTGAYA